MSNFYSVRSSRVTTPWFGTKKFYTPLRYDEVSRQHFCLKDDGEMPTVWGYETEDEAWRVIDEQMHQDYMAETYDDDYRCVDSGREDFHADG